MLRCRADPSDEDDVWLANEACVDDGEVVTALGQEEDFMLVRTKEGDEGFIKIAYVHKSTNNPPAQFTAREVARQKKGTGQRERQTEREPHVSLAEAAAISPADLVEAVRLHLPGELAKHGNAEGTRALTKFHQSTLEDEPEMAATAHSSRAGLVFCVQRSARQLWQQTGAHGGGPSDSMLSAAVFLAAVNEYICAEILELSGNAARDYKKCNIAPRHIFLAIRNDEELNKQFKDFAILGGGVIPVVKLAALLSVYCTKSELNYWLSQCRTFTLCCHRTVSWHTAATTAQLIGLFWHTRP